MKICILSSKLSGFIIEQISDQEQNLLPFRLNFQTIKSAEDKIALMTDSNSQPHPPDYQRPSDIQPEQLISFISLPHYELHKLINDPQNFVNKVSKLNNEAKQKIEKSLFKEALLLLNEAEKILQYAAGSGKNIDRDLIVCVLHNLSCVYRNLWIIPKCSTYIQGLIFNLDNQITSLQSSISSAQINENSYEKSSAYEIKKTLALYQLKFLATNSQLKQHKIAQNSGRKALSTLKNILSENQVYIKRLMKEEYEIVFQNTTKHSMPLDKKQYDNLIAGRYNLLSQILNFSQKIDIKAYKNIIKAAHFAYQIFNKEKYMGKDHPFSSFFKKYSIGDVMELKPLLFPQKKDTQQTWKINNRSFQSMSPEESLIFKFILLSITFFSLGTEMRMLLNTEKEPSSSNMAKQNDHGFRQSDILHLLAIITITIFVPFETLYLKHLLNSYKLHYNSDFFDYKTVENESVSKIIFLISGKKYEKNDNVFVPSENEYHLKEKVYDKMKTEKQIQTVKKIKNTHSKSKDNKKSFKTISFLENKSTVIEKQDPTAAGSKSKSSEKTSKNKSKSKLKKKSQDMSSTVKKQHGKKNVFQNKMVAGKNKKSPLNLKDQKSRSKSKKKSLSRYEEKYKSGSNSSSNKETYFLSRQIGLSSILQNGTKSKLEKERQGKAEGLGTGDAGNNKINLRKVKSTKNLKEFAPTTNGKSQTKIKQKSPER